MSRRHLSIGIVGMALVASSCGVPRKLDCGPYPSDVCEAAATTVASYLDANRAETTMVMRPGESGDSREAVMIVKLDGTVHNVSLWRQTPEVPFAVGLPPP
jgi:hypothetical protein